MNSRNLSSALALVACALLFAAPVFAAEPDYLGEMPTPAEVVEKITGQDAFDTAARQYLAFSQLFSMTMELVGDRDVTGDMTPAEKALRDSYNDGSSRVQRGLLASLPEGEREFRPDSKYGQWRALVDRYFGDSQFNDELMKALFSATFRANYAKIHAAYVSTHPTWVGFTDPPPAPAPKNDWTLVWVGFLLLGGLAGLGGGVRYGRRRGD